ncbi:hypothetical protein HDV00_003890 [Rhizophlyctis rosea]|nr:hypothetical protein HDV00_003890 [Rhizophlyctis rosea]
MDLSDFDTDFNPIHLATLSPVRRLTAADALPLLQQIKAVFDHYVAGDPLRCNIGGRGDAALKTMQKVCSPWLVRLLDRSAEWEENDETEAVVDAISDLMAQFCGRTATAQVTRTWRFKSTELVIQEPSFSEADIGFQTWGAGVVLAQLIDDHTVDVKDKVVLELGSGTGVTGLVCARAGARKNATDYAPSHKCSR